MVIKFQLNTKQKKTRFIDCEGLSSKLPRWWELTDWDHGGADIHHTTRGPALNAKGKPPFPHPVCVTFEWEHERSSAADPGWGLGFAGQPAGPSTFAVRGSERVHLMAPSLPWWFLSPVSVGTSPSSDHACWRCSTQGTRALVGQAALWACQCEQHGLGVAEQQPPKQQRGLRKS